MTPTGKSTELINKFSPLVTTWDCYFDSHRLDQDILADAKKCALIAVDEIIKLDDFSVEGRSYWQKVKQEIENS